MSYTVNTHLCIDHAPTRRLGPQLPVSDQLPNRRDGAAAGGGAQREAAVSQRHALQRGGLCVLRVQCNVKGGQRILPPSLAYIEHT